jgi:hypothetical protein
MSLTIPTSGAPAVGPSTTAIAATGGSTGIIVVQVGQNLSLPVLS